MAHTEYQACIDACNDCMIECEHCTNACLQEENVTPLAACIKLNRDCAAACYLAARLMNSGSRFVEEFCGLCARICDQCAEECEKHGDEHCRKCAAACRRCAEECRKMSRSKVA